MTVAIAVAVGLLVYGALSDLLVGNTLYTLRNLAVGVLLVAVARQRGLTWDALGLAPDRLGEGLRWGLGAVVVVAVAVAAGVALADRLPGVATLLSDQRAVMDQGSLAFHTLWRIPVGTALVEEVAFRGVLLALLAVAVGPVAAVVWSSAVFGLWHISSTIVTLRANSVEVVSVAGLGAIGGAVVVTAVAGVLFCLLRLGSGSLVAPVLAHWATNAFGLLAAHMHRASTL